MAKIENTSTVSYKYTLPDQTEQTGSINSNVSSTENMTTAFSKVKTADKEYALLGDTLKLTLTLTNTSEYAISSVKIKDTIDNKATFSAGSVTIDGKAYADFDPAVGFDLPNEISANGGSAVVEYSVKIKEDKPATDVCNFISDITYSVNEVGSLSEKSNLLALDIVNPTLTILKSADKTTAIKDETITYTNVIKNEGNVKHTLVKFTDPLSDSVTFVAGSVKVNDTTEADFNPVDGFTLADLEENAETTVVFAVTVN